MVVALVVVVKMSDSMKKKKFVLFMKLLGFDIFLSIRRRETPEKGCR